jgi:cytochrome P450
MRLLPPVPLHPRIVAEDTALGGHRLPSGSEVFLSIFHMHHDPKVFEDAESFSPRRWETIKPTVYEYNPFSAGPRMCIGASFAMMEIKLVLATLLSRFHLELPRDSKINPRVAITMAPHGGLKMTVRKRGTPIRCERFEGKVRKLARWPS